MKARLITLFAATMVACSCAFGQYGFYIAGNPVSLSPGEPVKICGVFITSDPCYKVIASSVQFVSGTLEVEAKLEPIGGACPTVLGHISVCGLTTAPEYGRYPVSATLSIGDAQYKFTDTLINARPGDINADGCVDDLDLFALTQDFLNAPGSASGTERTDITGDGKVDDFDLFLLSANFLEGC